MAEMLEWRDNFQNYFKSMSLTQRATIVGTLILIVLAFVLIFRWIGQPDYALLFSELELKEADQITELLRVQNVPYKLTGGGTGIMIPSKDIYEWRMTLAAQGLPSSGGIGFEIFDKNDIGISDFVQEVNYRRALEGELARTITGIAGIQNARVHIVIPKARLFKEKQEFPTASVVLKTGNARRLAEHQIMGIAHLVASSVEGLQAKDVTIVDSNGEVLSRQYEENSMVGVSASQQEFIRKVESSLEDKAESMLAPVVGMGKAVVKVSAELNFERLEQTDEQYDADNAAILSEELNSEENTDVTGVSLGTREHTVTNYQVPKTVRHTVSSVGDIRRLSIAVLVDGKRESVADEEGIETEQYVPRSDEEMAQFAAIVRNAVGFNQLRGDQLHVTNIEFDATQFEAIEFYNDPTLQREFWFDIAQRVIPVLLIVPLLFVLRSRLKQIKLSVPGAARGASGTTGMMAQAAEESAGIELDKMSVPKIDAIANPEAMESAKLLKQISDFAGEKSSLAARLIRYWMIEE